MDPTGHVDYKRLFGEYMARDSAARAKLDLMDRLKQMPLGSEPAMTPDKMIYGMVRGVVLRCRQPTTEARTSGTMLT